MIGISNTRPKAPSKKMPSCVKSLVRYLDAYTGFYNSGIQHERIVNSIGVLPSDMSAETAAEFAKDIQNNNIDLLAIHLAEDLPTDQETQSELNLLKSLHLLGPHTTLIHGVGLSPEQLLAVKQIHASIVWSPRSNFEIYGVTANVEAAVLNCITVALAPD